MPDESPRTVDESVVAERPGTRIGQYKLLQQIGEGGMGIVYMAEQLEPVRRKVALKIIKPGMDSQQVIARFEAERQALAMMDHQNIARVLDAGTIHLSGGHESPELSGAQGADAPRSEGRPYFVMELVHGVPITQYCDDNKLTPRERLALFVPVCQAIQHAHQKGIIHRDIKPSNVLVTMYDDKPVPKVIDFGVAKAIEQRLTEKTMFTQFGALVGTFEYMSPEQAEMNAFGVDTRSDIYSLGVLLYELLTGTTPLERARLREAAYSELVRLIKEEEPPRPSARLSSSQNLPKIAAARKMEPAQLPKLLRGEIDWIVLKCLEKNRTRRYDTASGLARDVERYLADEPVEACPPSAGYRLRKFLRKHRTAAFTTFSVVLASILAVAGQTLNIIQAKQAEAEANRLRIAADEARRDALAAKADADTQRDDARVAAYAAGMGLAQRAWQEDNVARARELLAELPRTAAGRDLRGFEWYYLNRLCHLDLFTFAHGSEVNSIAFSPDSERLASGGEDGTVKVFECATGNEILSLKGHAGPIQSVAFSIDGRRLASGSSDFTIHIWDSATGKSLYTLKKHNNPVRSVTFTPQGHLATLDYGGVLRFWDIATGKELSSPQAHATSITSVAFSPDGERIALGNVDKTVRICNSSDGKQLCLLQGQVDYIWSLAFSPDGRRLLIGGNGGKIKIWDTASWQELISFNNHAGSLPSVAFSPDGLRVAAANNIDRSVTVRDSWNGRDLSILKNHTMSVTTVAFSPDGRWLASGSFDKTVMLWAMPPRQELAWFRKTVPVAISPDGLRFPAFSSDSTVKLFGNAAGENVFSLPVVRLTDRLVAISPDGRRLASLDDDAIGIWDIAPKEVVPTTDHWPAHKLFRLTGHGGASTRVAFSPDGRRLASTGADKTIKTWDLASGKEVCTLRGHGGPVTGMAFSPDGKRLASGSEDKTVRLWDCTSGKEIFSVKGHAGLISSVAFSPDGRRLASGSDDKTVIIWDCANGKELHWLKGHAGRITSMAFSPDGQRLASGSEDKTIKFWDTVSGKDLFSLIESSGILSVVFSADGQRLVTCESGGYTHFWETTISAEAADRRETHALVSHLFEHLGLRTDVLERLRTMPGLNPPRRQEAVAAAQTHPEDPEVLNQLAWMVVKLPGREQDIYQKAVRYSEVACQLKSGNGYLLNTMGVAYYRIGNFDKALKTLTRSDEINKKMAPGGSIPEDLAFIAMAHHQLGHTQQAQSALQQLRERVNELRGRIVPESQDFLHEAEALLAKSKTPGAKNWVFW